MFTLLLSIARWSILFIAVQYLLIGIVLALAGQKGLGWSYICYAAANVALYYASMGV